ncbi:coronin-6-like [Varroa jacobsoni]|uniref:Coronin n=1 Tax=Varroa destructor TaxID=109461 RepID=A0A7M7KE64_VARDE|nr:coronin-6-like [Varroa destructor]XP_022665478.1 coronin-6-like [Varroa destructor]XP_022665479.1 coronin-6-like [Varroa destructor]XP_022665480.1 coronin-6-like [Varroa destructor]XP_022665481.1 coronin-6-like [Varroa destructor]XP_022665482.1 coronin-6-like [Varroa destructor]XP_022686856.1 coronin-6-like [Varroa jacobsoni]XP_022686857.1 coronin-6-like [Varroa jacobsoni]XP_022686858.1 coronin-6-like [Varroa jacobsoni]XP_022686860.1 coronin-6-like [Varroa jacobsoni]XP_022686861.1 coro
MSHRSIVRSSKFRHIFGQALKKENCYDNIRITKSSWDSNFCCANPKFIAIITEQAGGGAFLVLPIKQVGRVDPNAPLVAGHKGPVLDIAWSPFNDNVIASACDDTFVRVWQIPNLGLVRTMTEPVVELHGHQRKVQNIHWHPSANNVLLSIGADCKLIIWNVGTSEILSAIDHPDVVFSACWNWDGSRIVTTCKDRKIRVYNPRSGEIECEGLGHEGAKPQKAIYLRDGLIFTTGFSRMSERQYALRVESALNEPVVLEELDTSNGVLVPYYDPDVNLLFLCAKGDSNIRYFEITEEAPFVHYINTYQSSEPQRGMCGMVKRGVDVTQCEIARFFKLHTKGLCEVISFTVPRKSDLFQDDLYPLTPGDVPALSADEWASGEDREPLLINLKDGYQAKHKDFQVTAKPRPKSNILDRMPGQPQQETRPASYVDSSGDSPERAPPPPVAAGISEEQYLELVEVMKLLKSLILKHEKRIRKLEDFSGLNKKREEDQAAQEEQGLGEAAAQRPAETPNEPNNNDETH